MNKWILVAALATFAAAPAQAHPVRHHRHMHMAATAHDSVMVDGKGYKVCTATIQDGCIQPREAGLGYGNRPTDVYDPAKADQHP